MADSEQRFVRNRTGAEVFVKGHGVVPAGFEGYVDDSDAVSSLVGASVFADVKPPRDEGEQLTSKQEAAREASDLGIDFDYDKVTEQQLRDMIDNEKEGGS